MVSFELDERINGKDLPKVHVIDMKESIKRTSYHIIRNDRKIKEKLEKGMAMIL